MKVDFASKPQSIADQTAVNGCLVNAARKNDLKAVRKLLKKGADPNSQTIDGSALHVAAALGYIRVIDPLLSQGAVNARSPRNETPLQLAAKEGRLEVVKYLLKRGARINDVCGLYGTALNAAASRSQLGAVRVLLSAEPPADSNVHCGPYGSALHAAIMVGNGHILTELLNAGADISVRGKDRCTPLQTAAMAGHLDVVKLLLIRRPGIEIDAPGGEHGTAVETANKFGQSRILQLLIEHRATYGGHHPEPTLLRSTIPVPETASPSHVQLSTQELQARDSIPAEAPSGEEARIQGLLVPRLHNFSYPRVVSADRVEIEGLAVTRQVS